MRKRILIVNNNINSALKPNIIKYFKVLKLYNVFSINNYEKRVKYSFLEKIFNKLRIPIDRNNFNKRVIIKVKKVNPDIIFVIKGNNIYPSTISKIRAFNQNIKLINWSLDNMLKKHNSSRYYDMCLDKYDIHFTTKSNTIQDYYKRGAKKVIFLNQAYSQDDHFPEKFNKDYAHDVLFIGSAEKERFNSLKYLAVNGIKVDIYGDMWDSKIYKPVKNMIIHKKPLVSDSYRKAISSSKISLCFLRKINDDIHTTRSIEIPACKGFMIAERTDEHKILFKEDEEAVYFSSDQELLSKVKYYLKNHSARDKIRNQGFLRAVNSKYDYNNMINKILIYC